MDLTPPFEGGCECGAVRYKVTCAPTVVYACHCTICQTQSGSAFGMAMRIPSDHFVLIKGRLKTFRRNGSKGNVFTNSFCADCGTRIHHVSERSARNGQVSLKPGTLDDTGPLVPLFHSWVRSAQPWVRIPDGATTFETQPDDPGWLLGKRG